MYGFISKVSRYSFVKIKFCSFPVKKNNNNATVSKITKIVVEKLYYTNLLKKITNHT